MTSNMIIHVLGEYIFFLILPILLVDIILCGVIIVLYNKKRKKIYIIVYASIILIELFAAQRFFFPTYWKYPDPLIHSDIVTYRDVEEIFGPFDKEGIEPYHYKAYYIYMEKEFNKHYYVIMVDTEGFCDHISDMILD